MANAEREDAEKGSQSEDYTDDRCRLVCLEPHGQHWQEVVASFQEHLGQTGATLDSHLVGGCGKHAGCVQCLTVAPTSAGLKPVPAALADMMHAAEEAE